jgi:NAD kinase
MRDIFMRSIRSMLLLREVWQRRCRRRFLGLLHPRRRVCRFGVWADTDVHGELHRTVDAIVTLGGDGTILHATSLFSSTYVPPVLSFSLGTLGFLLPFSMTLVVANKQISRTTSPHSQNCTIPVQKYSTACD